MITFKQIILLGVKKDVDVLMRFSVAELTFLAYQYILLLFVYNAEYGWL